MANSTQRQWRPPVGTIQVVDPSPLDWLFITWNTMEEPIRVDQEGHIVPALATDARWLDEQTLELLSSVSLAIIHQARASELNASLVCCINSASWTDSALCNWLLLS
jgi:hypothetical protein